MRADALRNRERLVEVAQSAFATNGIETSLEEIARQAGVGIGTLYRRFPRREDLIAAVLAERYLKLTECALTLAEHRKDADAALTEWLTLLVEHMAIYRGLSLAVKEAIHDQSTALGRTCKEMMDAGTALLERGQSLGVFRTDVNFYDVMSLCSGIVTAVERRAEKLADSDIPPVDPYLLLDVVLKGLRSGVLGGGAGG
ncbi:TetR/AcrR family transcriptional regulator [Catenulispora sp. NF23]|uniref:TetR/AcrR family transcriptional regulator n=1 Tax=Catenulispora pinistramenti TaxID=2705254 RepID=A0ABS5KK92_9ACTN|nr:TetR/AcrR family transcriptional regulator [Catenulispora pinistramenti]MBS2536709.1 TetR/AcrR family transcriptional regulator [Catenulispora pinistramenti]MBS2545766.1 TetR/AcrR family transcriptional regulator [Catenulispora pinistramenti]